MIEFLTLMLGLVAGVQTVELAAEPPVVAVELLLDGEPAGRCDRPPWRFVLDLGAELSPHELLAVGLDADGGEVARARQWLNLPRGRAEARVVLDHDEQGRPTAAGLAWASLESREPEATEVWFDGLPLVLDDPRRFDLPEYDWNSVHVLTAELRFAGGERVHAEASFGGVYGDRVATELTAVPVVVDPGRRGTPPSGFDAAFVGAGGEVLETVSTEAGGADVVVVRDEASQAAVRALVAEVERRMLRNHHERSKDLLPLRRDDRIQLVWPRVDVPPASAGAAADPGLFAASPGHAASEGGWHWLLSRIERPPLPQRIADAVAVAGVASTAANRPRAVVLIVDPGTPDRSTFSPARVRRYLARLHVPLVVWTAAEDGERIAAEWGEAESVATWRDLQAAVRRLRERLDRQSIVWLDGSHLPQSIRLADSVQDVSIAGSRPDAGQEDL